MRTRKDRRLMRLTVAIASGAVLLAGTTFAAHPATAVDGTGFEAQARDAGLSGAQAEVLQAQVEAEAQRSGGTQTAANEIRLPDGSELLLPLPGEAYARDLDAPVRVRDQQAPSSCGSYTFCAYSGTNFTGTVKRQLLCSEPISIVWNGPGSWSTDQSSGTRARMDNGSGRLIHTTPGAPRKTATATGHRSPRSPPAEPRGGTAGRARPCRQSRRRPFVSQWCGPAAGAAGPLGVRDGCFARGHFPQ